MLERKEKKYGEEGEKEILSEKREWQDRGGKIKTKRKMDECRAERKGQRHRQARKKGNPEATGERECKRKKRWRVLFVGTRREKTGIRWKKRKEGTECATYEESERIEHLWNGYSEIREREKKERRENLNKDGREIRWIKAIWKRRERIKIERAGG
jgi:hypothetical protein